MPSKAGVYKFLDGNGNVLYVGKANDLKNRVSSYFINRNALGGKTGALVDQIKKIKITIVESELEALLLEAFYIKKYRPKYNIRLADNKSYVKIKITRNDIYPNITLVRRESNFARTSISLRPASKASSFAKATADKSKGKDDKQAIYFGPFPSTTSVKLVLKTIRYIFPYISVRNHPKRVCLYYYLGLCPCPVVSDSKQARINYKNNIRNIIRILNGQSLKIMKELEKEREILSGNEQFEEAFVIQKKIDALSLITTPFHKPLEYDLNPNLRIDIREKEILELMQILNNNGMNIESLSRIECYDISNLQGTRATGSMVVFQRGEKEGSQYRKFKIKEDGKPNDYAMMAEVLGRRLKHNEWDYPNLIVVDGGKGQVSAGLEVLAKQGLAIPLIGLAKREETIIIPVGKLSFIELSLPKNSPSLHLITRIRDEAHRFAINYHKNLRSKYAIFSLSHTRSENKGKKPERLR